MTLVKIKIPCGACARRPDNDSQPNFCKRCGGRRELKSMVSESELMRMGIIPEVLGAFVVCRKPAKRRATR